jgi:hypothetical protein
MKIVYRTTLIYLKTSFQGHKGYFHQNIIFLKLKLIYQSNRIINFTNSEAELFCGKVGDAKLTLVK